MALGILGGIGAFGGGFGSGVTSMFEMQEKLRKRMEDQAAFQAATLGGVGGLGNGYSGTTGTGDQPTDQTSSTGSPTSQDATPTPGNDPSTMVGGISPIPSGQFQPVGNVANASMAANQPNPSMVGAARQRVYAELQNDPATNQQFNSMVASEAGPDPVKRQRVGEGMIMRAVYQQVPLKAILSQTNYYPGSTYRRAAREGPQGQEMAPATWDPVNPAMTGGYASGNASMDPRTGRQVGYGRGGEQTSFTGGYRTGEGTGVEARDMPRAREFGYQPTGSRALGPGGTQQKMEPSSPVLAELEAKKHDIGKIKPEDLAQSRDKGSGPLTIGQAARRIEQVMPNAPMSVKWGAMQKLMKLVNEEDQRKWQRWIQERTIERQEQSDIRAGRREERQDTREARQEEGLRMREVQPFLSPLTSAIKPLTQRVEVADPAMRRAVEHMKILQEMSKGLNFTGLPDVNAVKQYILTKLGSAKAKEYDFQLDLVRKELGTVMGSASGAGATTVDTAQHMRTLMNGVMSPEVIGKAIKAFQNDVDIGQRVFKGQVNDLRARENKIMKWVRTGEGAGPFNEPAYVLPEAPTTAPEDMSEKRARAKAAGWSDEQIDEYLKGKQ